MKEVDIPLLLLLLILTASFANENEPIITTKYGKVRGNVFNVLDGQLQAFRGIPYAKPPSENRRFKPPEPMDKWNDVRNAQSLPNSCYQLRDDMFPGFEGAEMWNPNTPVSEDCLYLNVWAPLFKTPTPRPEDRVPVLVWIYGGAFMSGTSTLDIYQGHFLCKAQNVVVVSINYSFHCFQRKILCQQNQVFHNSFLTHLFRHECHLEHES
uniref:Cholinesterase n=1 Tax=Poecilia latipinna TaxID=48699 RepID=A0A3B3U4Q7_9TELE